MSSDLNVYTKRFTHFTWQFVFLGRDLRKGCKRVEKGKMWMRQAHKLSLGAQKLPIELAKSHWQSDAHESEMG